jgi:hypothetical protein
MAVYLGSSGVVQLARSASGTFQSMLDPADVNKSEKRFSFDFPNGTFITGDRISIARLEPNGSLSGQPLDFVSAAGWGDGTVHSDGTWFVNVDPLGGLRLYYNWADALSGSKSRAIDLAVPLSTYLISATPVESAMNCIGQILDYELTTNRAAIDVTSLGDAFVQSVSGLISGGGSITCLWDWRPAICGIGAVETAQYFHQLVLRQQLGSNFRANFFLKQENAGPIDEDLPGLASKTALYYDVQALITNVAIGCTPTGTMTSTIQFATTGAINLLYALPSAYLILQEDSARISTEDGSGFMAQESET